MNAPANTPKEDNFYSKVISPFLCGLIVIGFAICFYYVFAYRSLPAIAVLVGLILVGVFFFSYQVGADKSGISIYYGLGLISYHVDVGSIESAKIGKNAGITGFLYNMTGSEAVVLLMRDGTSYFIPLKDPRGLIKVIERKR
jgi:hypothetical protein